MKNVILITKEMKDNIESCGLSLDCLIPEEQEKFLSRSDIYDIHYMTNTARSVGGALSSYGFSYTEDDNKPVADSDMVFAPSKEVKPLSLAHTTELQAYCPNANTIVLWYDEDGQTANNMFKVNLRAILNAMSRVLQTKAVIASQQFELFALRG